MSERSNKLTTFFGSSTGLTALTGQRIRNETGFYCSAPAGSKHAGRIQKLCATIQVETPSKHASHNRMISQNETASGGFPGLLAVSQSPSQWPQETGRVEEVVEPVSGMVPHEQPSVRA